jgi:hypothetical protein
MKKYRNIITSSGKNEFHSLSSKVMFISAGGGTMPAICKLAYFAK